jgi:glucose-1-phosphate cytidylyltransferase
VAESVKVVILAGGAGSRLSEETDTKPKPMVEIGRRPILWHIVKYYAHYGFKDFLIALGYRGDVIKRFFVDYHDLTGNLRVDLPRHKIEADAPACEDWVVHLVETGSDTLTGGRLKRLEKFLAGGTFMVTYGDGLSDVDLRALLKFHKAHGRIATVTAVRPPARFGELILRNDLVTQFAEKPQVREGWINGGFFVFEPSIFKYLEDDDTGLEALTLRKLVSESQLNAFRHEGFWQCMDTLRDKRLLENLWREKRAPWRIWD